MPSDAYYRVERDLRDGVPDAWKRQRGQNGSLDVRIYFRRDPKTGEEKGGIALLSPTNGQVLVNVPAGNDVDGVGVARAGAHGRRLAAPTCS